jgi:HD-GYP domain-containing protein (c-di-GMP phosphodiesterase class II)
MLRSNHLPERSVKTDDQSLPQSQETTEAIEESCRHELLYQRLWRQAKRIYAWGVDFNLHKKGDIDTLKTLIQRIEKNSLWSNILKSLDTGDDLLISVFMPRKKFEILTHHPVNVTILSLKLGLSSNRYSATELKQLGIAALVHDLGMTSIPNAILNKESSLSKDEIKMIRKHPSVGKSILVQLGKEYQWLATICYQEHERENGKGYPEGLAKERIHEMAKIIGLTDTVDAMVNPRPWKKTQSAPYIIQSILSTQKDFFSPNLVKTFLREVSPFPPGSYIRLNSKEIGQVIGIAKDYPLRPKLTIYIDSNGLQLPEPKKIELKMCPLLHIIDTVDINELPPRILDMTDNLKS